ncbi:hypothetical protein BDP27DRAFT_1400367 [Rhodocollybia butyracea]|uniref:F-box domain-containing protein n=1 Tax=Rhodocollybia butyracea TaxID=206335 RepID=A0A9P5Q195_9AGAR|nr:hypothetical protein BDP27DRAFT_1400367 [Rhodocollybia butyracea]
MANPLFELENMDTTPPVLMISEILENIFQHCDERANRSCNVLVCKAWSEPCMNAIWREVTDLHHLIKPLKPPLPGVYGFSDNKPLDWDRFLYYSRRVRILNEPGYTSKSHYSATQSLLTEIAYQRPSHALLPNLKVLEFYNEHAHSRFILMLADATIRHYIFHSSKGIESKTLLLNLRTVAARCPHLERVKISMLKSQNYCFDAVLEFFKKLPNVKHIELSSFRDMVALTSVFRVIPNLKILAITSHRHTEDEEKPFIESLAIPPLDADIFMLPTPGCVVQMDHLRPLLCCTNIRSFKLLHPFPITLNDQFAEEMATSWPDLEDLYLSHVPLIQRRDFKNRFTLRALLSFARNCRRIQHLFLLFFPQPSTCPSLNDIESVALPLFSRLRTLDVGFSMLYECDRDVDQVATTLSMILPKKCSLKYPDKQSKLDSVSLRHIGNR